MKQLLSRLERIVRTHIGSAHFVVVHILPILLRTRRRPVIFSKYSGIGDIICTFPAATALKERHPGATFLYNCSASFKCLPRLANVTTHVTSYKGIGHVAHWYSFFLGGYYQFASDDDRPDTTPTDVYIQDFGRPYGLNLSEGHPKLQTGANTAARIKNKNRATGSKVGPLIVIHTGPSWPVREWPKQSWEALIDELRSSGYSNIVQVGTSSHGLTEGAGNAIEVKGASSLIDSLTLEETIALISEAQLFIGIDSGLLHAAAAVRTPSVGLWGPTSHRFRFAEKYSALFLTSPSPCQGCHHRPPRLHWIQGCPHNIACMSEITVESVLAACLLALNPNLIKQSDPLS